MRLMVDFGFGGCLLFLVVWLLGLFGIRFHHAFGLENGQ
jgi:hypothetical protein